MLSINDRKRKSSMSLSKDASASTKLRHNHLGGQDSQSMSTESPHSSNEGRQPSLMGFDLIQEQLLELEWRREEDRDELWSVVRSLNDQIKELRENRVVDERTKNVLESSSSVSSLTSLRRQAASDHILVKREEDGSPDSDIYNA
jgi:hypothetical protein